MIAWMVCGLCFHCAPPQIRGKAQKTHLHARHRIHTFNSEWQSPVSFCNAFMRPRHGCPDVDVSAT